MVERAEGSGHGISDLQLYGGEYHQNTTGGAAAVPGNIIILTYFRPHELYYLSAQRYSWKYFFPYGSPNGIWIPSLIRQLFSRITKKDSFSFTPSLSRGVILDLYPIFYFIFLIKDNVKMSGFERVTTR